MLFALKRPRIPTIIKNNPIEYLRNLGNARIKIPTNRAKIAAIFKTIETAILFTEA